MMPSKWHMSDISGLVAMKVFTITPSLERRQWITGPDEGNISATLLKAAFVSKSGLTESWYVNVDAEEFVRHVVVKHCLDIPASYF